MFITKFLMTKTIQFQFLRNLRSKHYKTTLIKVNSLRFPNYTKSLPPISLKKLLVLILLKQISKFSSTCNKSYIVPTVITKPQSFPTMLHLHLIRMDMVSHVAFKILIVESCQSYFNTLKDILL